MLRCNNRRAQSRARPPFDRPPTTAARSPTTASLRPTPEDAVFRSAFPFRPRPRAAALLQGARTDEPIVLAGRPHAYPAVGLSLLRPELHGLVPAGTDAGPDRRSPAAGHPAACVDGGRADPLWRRAAPVPGAAGRPHRCQAHRAARAGAGDRRAAGGLAA